MTLKTVFIVFISVLVTIVLMNNTEEINFWIFGNARIPKLAVLGSMFVLGLMVGFMAGRPRKKSQADNFTRNDQDLLEEEEEQDNEGQNLSEEDRNYIK